MANKVTIAPSIDSKFDSTANDSDKSWVVPDNEVWKLLYLHVLLVTTATVGNRQLTMEILDASSNIILDLTAGAVQAASLTRHYGFIQGIYRETTFVADELQVPMPKDCYLGPGWTLRIYDETAVDAAADDMTVAFAFERIPQ